MDYKNIVADGDRYRKGYIDGIEAFISRKNKEGYTVREEFMPSSELPERLEEYRELHIEMLGLDKLCFDSLPEASMTYAGEDEDCKFYRVVVYITEELPFHGMLMIPHGTKKAPLVIAQHGGGGTPELCSDMNGKNNYNGMVRRLIARGAVVFAPQLLLWNVNEVLDTAPKHPIEYDRRGIDNKPVLFICVKDNMDKIFDSPEHQRQVFDQCREYCKKQGFDGMIFSTCIWEYNQVSEGYYRDTDNRGYDFHFGYNAGYGPEKDLPSDEEIIEGQCAYLKRRLAPNPMTHVPTASCFRDATPRVTEHWNNLGFNYGTETRFHLSADGFRKVIRGMKEICDALPEGAWGKRIFMLDNWNEWDEGHYISPCHEHGFKYLQAVREELTARDNLPDYRTPQDLGFTGLNTTWEVPDMTDICQKKLAEKQD